MTNPILPNNDEKITPNLKIREPILKYDFPGIKIGIAQYVEGPTGCTVFYFDKTETKEKLGFKLICKHCGAELPKGQSICYVCKTKVI